MPDTLPEPSGPAEVHLADDEVRSLREAGRAWHQLLHNQTALRLKAQLLFRPGTVVVNVPYHVQHAPHARRLRRRGGGGDNSDIEAI